MLTAEEIELVSGSYGSGDYGYKTSCSQNNNSQGNDDDQGGTRATAYTTR